MTTANLVLLALAFGVALLSFAVREAGSLRRSFAWTTRRPLARFAAVAVVVVGVVAAALPSRRAPERACDAGAHEASRDRVC